MLTVTCRAAWSRPVVRCCQFIAHAILSSALLGAPLAFGAESLDKQVTLDIPPQSLDTALMQFAKQADLQVMLAANSVAGRTTAGVKGTLSAGAALTALLAGTNMSFTTTDGTVTVAPRAIDERAEVADQHSFRVAQESQKEKNATEEQSNSSTSGQAVGDEQNRTSKNNDEKPDGLQEVVVTGTHIRGITNSASPVQSFSRADIDATGSSTVQQFLLTLPQNFGGGASPNTAVGVLTGGGQANNVVGGSAPNLRGLGNDATLVLIDGHRVAPGNIDGNFVDVSMIPLTAIERIDVVTDGASAIYGSDAEGGVVNIILRRNFDGIESRAQYGTVDSGSSHTLQVGQTMGKDWGSGSAVMSYQYSDQTALSGVSRDYTQSAGAVELIPRQMEQAVYAALNQDLAPGFELLGDATYSHRTNADLTTPGPLLYAATADLYAASIGTRLNLSDKMQLNLAATYSESDTDSQIFYLEPLIQDIKTKSAIASAEANLDGVVVTLPSGPVRFAVGGQYRRETFGNTDVLPAENNDFSPSRNVEAGYVELHIPVLAPTKGGGTDPHLEFTIAGRAEEYSDFGSTNNPQVGVIWKPVSSLKFRGTYGTSFTAPLLSELNPNPSQIAAAALHDPMKGGTCDTFATTGPKGTCTNALIIFGGNADLNPEKAKTWTLGLDIRPEMLPGLTAKFTFYDIKISDRIQNPQLSISSIYNALNYESFLGPTVIQRNPPNSLVESLISSPVFVNYWNADTSNIGAIIDSRYQNLSNVETKGLDFGLAYKTEGLGGQLETGVDGTYIFDFDNQFTNSAPIISILNTVYNPPDLKLRARAIMSRQRVTAGLYINYVAPYTNNIVAPNSRVSSWTTADAVLSYEFASDNPLLRGLVAALSINNLTGRDPPFVLNTTSQGVNYDGANANALGRYLLARIQKRW